MNSEKNQETFNPSEFHELDWYYDIMVSLYHSRNRRSHESAIDALDSIREGIFVLQLLKVLTLLCIVGAFALFLLVPISLIVN